MVQQHFGHFGVCTVLLEHNANVIVKANNGATPLF